MTRRDEQKLATRKRLLAVAMTHVRAGKRLSLDDVAEEARVSRRTAYRHFVSHVHLKAEAALETLRPQMRLILSDKGESQTAPQMLDSLILQLNRMSSDFDAELGTLTRISADSGRDLRGRRRVQWIEEVLADIKPDIAGRDYRRLVSALCVCVGYDAAAILRSVRQASQKEIDDVTTWMGRVLLEAALDAHRIKPAPKGRRRR